jgi:hypothetical protein
MGTPTCIHCKQRHFNFLSCSEALERRNHGAGAPVSWAKREGWTEFGDRLETVDRLGNTTFMARKPDGEEET